MALPKFMLYFGTIWSGNPSLAYACSKLCKFISSLLLINKIWANIFNFGGDWETFSEARSSFHLQISRVKQLLSLVLNHLQFNPCNQLKVWRLVQLHRRQLQVDINHPAPIIIMHHAPEPNCRCQLPGRVNHQLSGKAHSSAKSELWCIEPKLLPLVLGTIG